MTAATRSDSSTCIDDSRHTRRSGTGGVPDAAQAPRPAKECTRPGGRKSEAARGRHGGPASGLRTSSEALTRMGARQAYAPFSPIEPTCFG